MPEKVKIRMGCVAVLVLILATITCADNISIYPSNILPVGSNVTLISHVNVTTGVWIFRDNFIVLIFPGYNVINNAWRDRVTFDPFTSSLTIRSLKLEDSGLYSLQGESGFSDCLTLLVQDPLTGVAVKSLGPAILDEPFTLHCEVNGSVDSIEWGMYDYRYHNSWPISASNTTFFDMNNKTLTLNPVQHSDGGSYWCWACNSLDPYCSYSNDYKVVVHYGPEMPTITGPKEAYIGGNVTLSCNASSYPPSSYKWYFCNSFYYYHFLSSGSDYVSPPLIEYMSGTYICVAYNNVTKKSTTAHTILSVTYESIQNVQIKAPNDSAIEGRPYNLTCNVSGHVDHIYWMKNHNLLHGDCRIAFGSGNKTITFDPVDRKDRGYYQCTAVNTVGNMTSQPQLLSVYFGPDTPQIVGPSPILLASPASTATFVCFALSKPVSYTKWWFNDYVKSSMSVLQFSGVFLNMSGKYTCEAWNPVTGKSSTKSMMLTVIEGIQSVRIQNNTVPIYSENFSFICEVTGRYDEISWYKDKTLLSRNSSHSDMSYIIQYNSLYLTPVTRYSDGTYECVATIELHLPQGVILFSQDAQYKLQVNYGPQSVNISGPDSANESASVSLTCSADARPECEFSWFLNNQLMPLEKGSVLNFSATNQRQGNYTCQAWNPVTNITMYQWKIFTVASHASVVHLQSQAGLMLMGLLVLSLPVLFT